MAKGGQFHNKGHLLLQMEARGDLKPLPGRRAADLKASAAPLKGTAPKKAAKVTEPKSAPKAPKAEPKKGLLGRGRTKKEE
jgi:hypothetical protein